MKVGIALTDLPVVRSWRTTGWDCRENSRVGSTGGQKLQVRVRLANRRGKTKLRPSSWCITRRASSLTTLKWDGFAMTLINLKSEREHLLKHKKGKVILIVFFTWKLILFTTAALAPGPGYDTSALILSNPSLHRHAGFERQSFLERLSLKLFRWDALYFVTAAQRGQVYEQEWAFSWSIREY